MTCVKCYREQQAKQDRGTAIAAQYLHADVIYNGMSLCLGHFNRELEAI